jgi:cytochrome c1
MNRQVARLFLSFVAVLGLLGLALWGEAPSVVAAPPGAGEAVFVAARGVVAVGAERAVFAAAPADAARATRGREAWATVYKTLMSPRCMNCHPAGDAPLQTDMSRPHAMNISRKSVESGLACSTCHQTKNSEAVGVAGGPPGAPNWHLPDVEMPLIFQGRSARELCEQLKRPQDNGYKTLAALRHHVAHDPLVLWGWSPGGKRTKPPVTHEAFVAAFDLWVQSGGACPE